MELKVLLITRDISQALSSSCRRFGCKDGKRFQATERALSEMQSQIMLFSVDKSSLSLGDNALEPYTGEYVDHRWKWLDYVELTKTPGKFAKEFSRFLGIPEKHEFLVKKVLESVVIVKSPTIPTDMDRARNKTVRNAIDQMFEGDKMKEKWPVLLSPLHQLRMF